MVATYAPSLFKGQSGFFRWSSGIIFGPYFLDGLSSKLLAQAGLIFPCYYQAGYLDESGIPTLTVFTILFDVIHGRLLGANGGLAILWHLLHVYCLTEHEHGFPCPAICLTVHILA